MIYSTNLFFLKSISIIAKGEAFICGDVYPQYEEPIVQPKHVCKSHSIKEIALGFKHTIFVNMKGRAYTFGVNERCILGNTSIPTGSVRNSESSSELPDKDIVSVAANECSSAYVTQKGAVYYWGKSFDGSSDIPKPVKYDTKDARFIKVQIGSNFMVALSGNFIFVIYEFNLILF